MGCTQSQNVADTQKPLTNIQQADTSQPQQPNISPKPKQSLSQKKMSNKTIQYRLDLNPEQKQKETERGNKKKTSPNKKTQQKVSPYQNKTKQSSKVAKTKSSGSPLPAARRMSTVESNQTAKQLNKSRDMRNMNMQLQQILVIKHSNPSIKDSLLSSEKTTVAMRQKDKKQAERKMEPKLKELIKVYVQD